MYWCGYPWVHLVRTSLCSQNPDVCFLCPVREVFSCYFFKYVFCPFLFLLFLGLLLCECCFVWSCHRDLASSPFLKILFLLLNLVLSTTLSSTSLIHSSESSNLFFIPCIVFFVSVVTFFNSDCCCFVFFLSVGWRFHLFSIQGTSL